MKKRSDGYIALLAVLIIGGTSMAIGMVLLVTGVNSQKSTLVSQQSIQARQLASTCVEEALQKIIEKSSYVGSGNLTVGAGTCTYSVSRAGAVATITTSGVVNNVVKKLVVYATINTSNISITSWQEVS